MRRTLLACAVVTASAMPAALAAGTANAQLVVGVTVARSCMVDAQPMSPTASRLKLSCAAGAIHSLQLNQSTTTVSDGGRAAVLVAPTSPASSTGSQSDLRVLTLDF